MFIEISFFFVIFVSYFWLTNGRENDKVRKKINRPTFENNYGGKTMTYAEFFAEIKGKFMEADVSDITEHLAYQFNIVGDAEGIFYVEVKDGAIYVEPYEYYDRDAMFTGKAETFMKIASGKLDPVMAVTLQKLKVEGDIGKALRLKDFIEKKSKK